MDNIQQQIQVLQADIAQDEATVTALNVEVQDLQAELIEFKQRYDSAMKPIFNRIEIAKEAAQNRKGSASCSRISIEDSLTGMVGLSRSLLGKWQRTARIYWINWSRQKLSPDIGYRFSEKLD